MISLKFSCHVAVIDRNNDDDVVSMSRFSQNGFMATMIRTAQSLGSYCPRGTDLDHLSDEITLHLPIFLEDQPVRLESTVDDDYLIELVLDIIGIDTVNDGNIKVVVSGGATYDGWIQQLPEWLEEQEIPMREFLWALSNHVALKTTATKNSGNFKLPFSNLEVSYEIDPE